MATNSVFIVFATLLMFSYRIACTRVVSTVLTTRNMHERWFVNVFLKRLMLKNGLANYYNLYLPEKIVRKEMADFLSSFQRTRISSKRARRSTRMFSVVYSRASYTHVRKKVMKSFDSLFRHCTILSSLCDTRKIVENVLYYSNV